MMKNSLPLSLSRWSSSPPELKKPVGMYNDYGSHTTPRVVVSVCPNFHP